MSGQVLRGAWLGDAAGDVRIGDGSIAEVGTGLEPAAGERVVELGDYVLLPSPLEAHAHLDKAFLADVVDNPTGDLMGAIRAMETAAHSFSVDDTTNRAVRAIELMAANGCTVIRTHVDVTEWTGLRPMEAVLAARAATVHLVDVEIVALCGFPVLGTEGALHRSLLADAMTMGADLVGGCPHLEPSSLDEATSYLLQVAADHSVGVDLHTDETLDAGVLGLADLARHVAAGFEHPATASHCVSLSMLPEARQREVAEQVAAAGIGVVALPQTNLYLQGRAHAEATPRGITSVAALRAAGVPVAAGQDNLQDPFNPLGRGCPLDIAALMVLVSHLTPDDAYRTVSDEARRVLGREVVSLTVGSPADLLAVRAGTLRQALAAGPSDRLVWRTGTLTSPSNAAQAGSASAPGANASP